ncbi:MAG: hypothetical protein V4613_10115 [Bacteroidota bacterium]
MKRLFLFILLCTIAKNILAQGFSDSILTGFKGQHFYYLSNPSNNKLIIFLHGGVNNPYFKQPHTQITLTYLIENNAEFLQQSTNNSFDIVAPITTDSLNWLTKPQESFVKMREFIDSTLKKYNEVYISGFSDGGTGAYKIFYKNHDYFSGLIVFNGYPQHENFYKSVNYSAITNKRIIFCSTFKDNTIPYEFLLNEYCSQKKTNANTYFYLTTGNHSFINFQKNDLKEVFGILKGEINNTRTEPIQGYVKNDALITAYPFRKKITRKFNFGMATYEANRMQMKALKQKKMNLRR